MYQITYFNSKTLNYLKLILANLICFCKRNTTFCGIFDLLKWKIGAFIENCNFGNEIVSYNAASELYQLAGLYCGCALLFSDCILAVVSHSV